MSKNDSKIMALRAKIEEKKKLIKKGKKFTPITNCSIELNNKRYNIQVGHEDTLTELLIVLNMMRLSAEDLEISNLKVSGYKVTDWITDIQSRLAVLSKTEEEQKLKALEKKLHNLLSTDKKVELEIEGIEELLK